MNKILSNIKEFEPVALSGGIGALLEVLAALILAKTELDPMLIGGIMTLIIAIVSFIQMILERKDVTPVMKPRKTNPVGGEIPLFPKEVKQMRDKAQKMRIDAQKMGILANETVNEAAAIEQEVKEMEEEAMAKGTREPVVLINSFIMVIEAAIPVAMMIGLLPQEQADELKALTGALMALVMAVGDFAAVLMIRDQVTPVSDPRDMQGEPLTP